MKIAFFSDNFYPELSGISDSIIATGTELARRGHEVHYFVPFYSKRNYATSGLKKEEVKIGENIFIHRLPSFSFPAPTGAGRLVIPNIFRALFSSTKFDIIHSQSIFGAGFEALCFAKWAGIPFVGTNHTLIEAFVPKNKLAHKIMRRYENWYYNKCDFVTTPSEFLRTEMLQRGLKNSSKTLSNPISSDFFKWHTSKAELKQKLGLKSFTILYAGRLSPEKNIMDLFDAFVLFAKKENNVDLVLTGQGILRKTLEEKAKTSGLGDRIHITGPFFGKNKKHLFEYFHAADVFAMPSTSETQSMGAIQAMAAGCAVILADSGPLPGLVKDDRGILFKPQDPESLAQAFQKLLSDGILREKLSANALAYAENFSVEKIADEWERIYNNATNSYGKP